MDSKLRYGKENEFKEILRSESLYFGSGMNGTAKPLAYLDFWKFNYTIPEVIYIEGQ